MNNIEVIDKARSIINDHERPDVLPLEDIGTISAALGIARIILRRTAEEDKAREEGWLVVLPCKVGDTAWTNFAMSGWYFRDKDKPYSAKVVFVGLNSSEDMGGGIVNIVYGKHDHMMQFNFSDIGKTVFLTRAEAEAAFEVHDG